MLAGTMALALLVFFAWVYLAPPSRTVALDGCEPSDTVSCTAVVDADPGVELTVVLGVGAVLLLVAILNRRFSSIKVGDLELGGAATEVPEDEPESDDDVEPVDQPVAEPAAAGAAGAPPDSASLMVESAARWQDLPDWAQLTLTQWSLRNPVLTTPVATAVAAVYEPVGPADHPWYVRLSDGTNERTLRLTRHDTGA